MQCEVCLWTLAKLGFQIPFSEERCGQDIEHLFRHLSQSDLLISQGHF